MLPSGTTWMFALDEEVEWLRGVAQAPKPGSEPFPQDQLDGRNFVSFRFWQTSKERDDPFPSPGLQEVMKEVLPFSDVAASRIGIAGWGDEGEALLDETDDDLDEARLEENTVEDDENADEQSFLTENITVIEAVTPLLPSERQSDVLEALQRVMSSLNEFSRVYRLANKISMVPLSYELLPASGVYWATRDPFTSPGGWDDGLELLLFPDRLPGRTDHPELDEERLKKLTLYWEVWVRGGPLLPYSERSLDARLALENAGDYQNCIVQCQIAIEVLFDTLLQLLLWEEGVAPRDAANELYREGLEKRVRSQFPPRLGGDWNSKGRGVVARWAQQVAQLRHRVVHTGYRPTRDEALEAMAILGDLDDFFRDRLIEKRTRYPRTTLMTLGSPGLKRYGVWSGKIRAFAERADEEPNWIHAFNEWRKDLLDERSSVQRGGRARRARNRRLGSLLERFRKSHQR